ncbi:MAG: putative phosphoribosyl transferase [Cellvibrionaceae bacterium]|jgi:putative phosphoribosyl transferase
MIKLPKQNLSVDQSAIVFENRIHAGDLLAPLLADLLARKPELSHAVVVGVPRGGVAVAAQVAHHLDLPLDIMVTGKILAPGRKDIVIGAVTERGRVFINRPLVTALGLDETAIQAEVEAVKKSIKSTTEDYRSIIPHSKLTDKTVIIIDDNVVTGATMFATLRGLWAERPTSIVLAIPVAPASTLAALADFADEVIALQAPESLDCGIEAFYSNMQDISKEHVLEILQKNH